MVRVFFFDQGLCLWSGSFSLVRVLRLLPTGVLDFNRTTEPSSPPSTPSSLSSSPRPSTTNPPSDSGYHVNSGAAGLAEDLDSGAQGIHLLLRPPDLLSPSLPPPLPPHTQPTLTPPPPWEQGPALEEAWGSGDYLETLSFIVPDGEELALATSLPSHPYEDDTGGDWVSYDTAFPTRPTLSLSTPLPLSPSTSTSSIPLHTHPTHPDVFPTWDEDYDLEDMTPLEPTELLLPDMNSLEYYTNLLAKERDNERQKERENQRERDQEQVNQTDSKTPISPTTTQPPSPSSASPPGQGHNSPQPGPTPPPNLSPTLTGEKKPPVLPMSPKTPSTPFPPKPTDRIQGQYPPRPPSNTTSRVPPPPPLGPPTRPERPERLPVVTETPVKDPPTKSTKASTTSITTTTQNTAISLTRAPPVTTPRVAQPLPTRQYLCNVTKPEMYLVRVGKSGSGDVT